MYKHPGVYIEHVPSGLLTIEAASTSIAAFVGPVKRGALVTADSESGKPVFVSNSSQFAKKFGVLNDPAGGVRDEGQSADYFGHAVSAFFANGGTKAYIVPIGSGNGAKAVASLIDPDDAAKAFFFNASSAGSWANGLWATITETLAAAGQDPAEYEIVLGQKNDKGEVEAIETFSGVVLSNTSGRYLLSQINGQSELVTVEYKAKTADSVAYNAATKTALAELKSGTDHGAPNAQKYKDAFVRLRDYRDISIVLTPGQHWIKGGDNTRIEAAIAHAEFMKNRMVIVDPPLPTGNAKLISPKDVKDLGLPTSPYTALYYPWVDVPNPHFDADTAANKPRTFNIPPSGLAAGMWARIDGKRGVWKAPAGLEATVRGTRGPTLLIGNDIQDNLNEWGINCMRSIVGPTVIWGARTLASKTKPEFRYVPVRRTQNMIGESLYTALQTVVFEPNDHRLWSSLRAAATNFMDMLHRAGAFQGEKASDAYYVRCGLESTMTQADIDAGIVRLVVGFAPLKPAEFVVVQIQQIVGQTA